MRILELDEIGLGPLFWGTVSPTTYPNLQKKPAEVPHLNGQSPQEFACRPTLPRKDRSFVGRLHQICGFDSQIATTEHSSTKHYSSGWIDYGQAEASLFSALNGRDGYAQILAADYGHHFGPDVGNPEIVEEFAEALFPKAAAILNQHGTRRAFSDRHLFAKCQQWATFWCSRGAQRYVKRPHTKYSPESAALGRERGNETQKRDADRRAYMAQDWHSKGISIERIAQRLKCGISSVYRLLKRVVAPWYSKAGKVFSSGKDSCTVPKLFTTEEVPERIPDEKRDAGRAEIRTDERCSNADRAEIEALRAQIRAELTALYPHRAADLAKLAT